jgi:hypothetical protein
LSGLLAVADLFMLGLAIGFGPEGLGGDGTVPSDRAAVEHAGIVTGFLGLAMAVAAVISFLVLARHRRRNDVLAWLVGAQGLMLVLLVGSGFY